MQKLVKTIDRINHQFIAHDWAKSLDYDRVKEFAKASLNLLLISDEIKVSGGIPEERFKRLLSEAREMVDKTFKENSAPHLFYRNLISMIDEAYEKIRKEEME